MAKHEISQRLRARRNYLRMTQREIAERAGLTRSNYTRYELGDIDIPSSVLPDLARAMGVTVSYFYGEDESDLGADPQTEAGWRSLTMEQQEIIKASIRAAQAVNERGQTIYGKKAETDEE